MVEESVIQRLGETANSAAAQRLRKVINGTGIAIHTNLGRAPLARAAIDAMVAAAACTNLEVDLSTGERGRRGVPEKPGAGAAAPSARRASAALPRALAATALTR